MKRVMIISVILLGLSGGCKEVVKMRYGVKEPGEETPASIQAFMKKKGQPATSCLIFKDSTVYCRYLKDPVFRENMLGSFIFNPRGLVIHYKDTAKCRWSATSFIRGLRSDTLYQVDTAFRFGELFANLTPLIPGNTIRVDQQDYDFVVVITWAVFAGKLNERLFQADEAAAAASPVRTRVLFLNTDMQKSWKLRPGQKLVIR
jgi:hypothetical protein